MPEVESADGTAAATSGTTVTGDAEDAVVTATASFSTHADPLDREVRGPDSLGPVGLARWTWRRLTSMRTALILLLLLGLAAIPGSVVPQRSSDPLRVDEFGSDNPGLAQWYDRFGLFDVYGTPWFAAIYLLLFVSLVGCLVPRARQHWRLWRASPAPPPRRLDGLPDHQLVATDDPAQALAVAERALRERRWKVRTGTDESGRAWVAAERGFVRETGNQIFHFALLGVLAAVGWGALAGWHGNVVIREGGGFANTITQYDTFSAGRFAGADSLPPFSFVLDSFDVEFERGEAQRGAPREFDARLTVTGPDGQRSQATLDVNHPLEIDGTSVFLIGHGYAPRLRVRDGQGRVVVDDSTVFLPQDGNFTSTGVVKAPDADPQLGLRGLFAPTATIDRVMGPTSLFPAPDNPVLFLSAFTGDLGLDDRSPQSVYELDTEAMARLGLQGMNVGDTWTLPKDAGTVEFVGVERWISVKVAHDPGGRWALLFVALAIVGICLSLFVKRRRLWVRAASPGPGAGRPAGEATAAVVVAGIGRGDNTAMDREVARIATACRPAAQLPRGVRHD